jgi:hypothetical protein
MNAMNLLEQFTRQCRKEKINFVCSFQLPDQKFGIAQCGTKTSTMTHIAKLHRMAMNTDAKYFKIGKEVSTTN